MRNAFRIFRRDMKRLLRNPAAILVLIGVSILPHSTHGLILQQILILMPILPASR